MAEQAAVIRELKSEAVVIKDNIDEELELDLEGEVTLMDIEESLKNLKSLKDELLRNNSKREDIDAFFNKDEEGETVKKTKTRLKELKAKKNELSKGETNKEIAEETALAERIHLMIENVENLSASLKKEYNQSKKDVSDAEIVVWKEEMSGFDSKYKDLEAKVVKLMKETPARFPDRERLVGGVTEDLRRVSVESA